MSYWFNYAHLGYSVLAEPQEPVLQPLPQDKESLLKHLEKTNPESLALARDWDDTARNLLKAQKAIERYVEIMPYIFYAKLA